MVAGSQPTIEELDPRNLSIQQPLTNGGNFSIICCETNIICTGTNAQGQSLTWAWDLIGGTQQSSAVQNVTSNTITYLYQGATYQLQIAAGMGSCQQLGDGSLRFLPNAAGKLTINLNVSD